MAIKSALKRKQKKQPPLAEVVDKLIKSSRNALVSGDIKANVADLIRFVHLRRKLFPVVPVPGNATWIDSW